MAESEFPVADVSARKVKWFTQVSRMWVITIVCVIVAIGLTLNSLESAGPEIVIRFPEGHGLKAGDAIRHRGIDIGHVETVDLSGSLEGVEVRAVLDQTAAAIACEGSRFWIVRPQLDLTGVSGLETAVGSKYIAVIPGNTETEQFEFEGLGVRPPDGLGRGGIELILRGDHRFGVNPGSPLTWRGVEVGQVLSSSLSPDALHIDTRVRVREPYRRLLRRNSKFWVTSGIHMGFDVSGFEFSTDSLASVARGGIAFITPDDTASDQPVQPGDVFTLHKELDDNWIESSTAIDLLELRPPPVAIAVATWKQKLFGITRTHQSHASALTIADGTAALVMLPADLVYPPPGAIEDSHSLVYRWDETEHQFKQPMDAPSASGEESASGIASLRLEPDQVIPATVITAARIRVPERPEDCFAIRRSWHSDSDSAVVIEMIGKDELTGENDRWRCSNTKLSRDVWHGAAVVASEDEKVIGILVVSEDFPAVVPLPSSAAGG